MNEAINDVLRKDYDLCVKDLKKSEKKREKLEKENQRLKEEYVMLQNASEEYEDKLLKENQRLNNILNELENWLIKIINLTANIDEKETCKNVLDKLNELKESDR